MTYPRRSPVCNVLRRRRSPMGWAPTTPKTMLTSWQGYGSGRGHSHSPAVIRLPIGRAASLPGGQLKPRSMIGRFEGERRRMLRIGDGCYGLRGAGRGSIWSRQPPAAKASVSPGRGRHCTLAHRPSLSRGAHMRSFALAPGIGYQDVNVGAFSWRGDMRVLVHSSGGTTNAPALLDRRAGDSNRRPARAAGGTLRALDASDEGKGI